jgi:hypothetical protein
MQETDSREMRKRLLRLIKDYFDNSREVASDLTAFSIGLAIGLLPLILRESISLSGSGVALEYQEIFHIIANAILLGVFFLIFNGIADKAGAIVLFILTLALFKDQEIANVFKAILNESDISTFVYAFIFFSAFRICEFLRFNWKNKKETLNSVEEPDALISLNIRSEK